MDKVFVERYMNYINKTPLTRKLEDSIFQYINLYNKIQQLHALYFKNLKMVDSAFVQSLDNYKEDIHDLKVAHGKLVDGIQSELLSYYALTHQLTGVLRDVYSCVNELAQLKHRFLEQSILSTKQKIEIMYHLVNNPDYKKLVTQLMMNLSQFDKLSEKRNLHCNHVMLLIDAVKTCEEDLVANYDVNKYDLMVNISNPKFIKYIEAQLSFHNRLMSDLTGLETTLKTKAFPKLWEVISEFKREHRVDPNYAIEDVSENSFRDTFQRYLKLSKAIETNIGALQQEHDDLGELDKLVSPNNKLVSPNYFAMKGKPIAIQRGWQWRHPKIVKMVAERDLMSDILQKKRLVQLPLKTKEIEFCIQENDTEYGWCKNQSGGAKKRSRSKSKGKGKKSKSTATNKAKKLIKGYLDYSQLLTALSANKAKYARVLTELYQVRDALNKNEYINALDDAVNQLQSQADRVRLTKIMAASHEADYQDYIRQLTEDNPTLARLAEKNRYASFIMKKGQSSQEDYYNELDADNMDNFERRSQQIMTSVHNENILKDSVKSMIKKAFESRAGQSVFDLASTDNRYLEAPSYRGFYLGGGKGKQEGGQEGGMYGNPSLNPLVFNPFSLISDTEQCLQVMKMGKEEVVAELKTMLKLRYNGDELKRYLAKVDIIANRIMESLKKDRCKVPYAPTLTAQLAERYVKLGCTLRCMHLDALYAANLKGGLIGRQAHQALGILVKRLIDVECQRLALVANEARLLGDKGPKNLKDIVENCILAPLASQGFLANTGNGYKLSADWLKRLSVTYGINVHDLPNNNFKAEHPGDLVYLVKDVESVLKRVAWGVRDKVDRAQKEAVFSAMSKKKVEKCCTRAHKYSKAMIVKKNAQDYFKHEKLFLSDKEQLNQRMKMFCDFAQPQIAFIKNFDKRLLAHVILDINNPSQRGLGRTPGYGMAVNDLNGLIDMNTVAGNKSKTLARLYTYHIKNREAPLHQVIQADDLDLFNKLVSSLEYVLKTAQEAGRPAHWTDDNTAKAQVEQLKKPIDGYLAGEPVPVILCNLKEVLDRVDTSRYDIQCQRETDRLKEFKAQATSLNHNDDYNRYKAAYARTQNTAQAEHARCVSATSVIANCAMECVQELFDVLQIFRHFNRGVVCLVNAMMPKDQQITCAKATVGNNIHIDSLIDLGRRLNAIGDTNPDTRKIMDCNALAEEIQSLRRTWCTNRTAISQALERYMEAIKNVDDKEKEITREKDLLEYVQKGAKLREIGELMNLKREKEDASDVLRMRVHKLEREANEHHRNISKSLSRYRKMVAIETDHVALLKEIMKFIELWNKCYSDASTAATDDPIEVLLGRIGGSFNVLNCINVEIDKYAGMCQPNPDLQSILGELNSFLDAGALEFLLKKAEPPKEPMAGGAPRRRRRRVVKRKAKRKAKRKGRKVKRKTTRKRKAPRRRRRVVKRKAKRRSGKRRAVRRRRR